MVLFAHFQSNTGVQLEGIIEQLNPTSAIEEDASERGTVYQLEDGKVKLILRREEQKPDVVTITLDIEDQPAQQAYNTFKATVQRVEESGFSFVSDRVLFSERLADDVSLYWSRIYGVLDKQRRKVSFQAASITQLIEDERGHPFTASMDLPPHLEESIAPEVNIEFDKVRDEDTIRNVIDRKEQHRRLLDRLAPFIQYIQESKRLQARSDPKVGIQLDEILLLSYDLLSRPQDHEAFDEFLGNALVRDRENGELLYRTVDFIHTAALLIRGELGKRKPDVPKVLQRLGRYGRADIIIDRLKSVAKQYDDLSSIDVFGLLGSRYSEYGMLRSLVDLEHARITEAPNQDKDTLLRLMLRYGSFKGYLRSERGKNAQRLLFMLRGHEFNDALFTSDEHSADIFSRQNTSVSSWEQNFDDLIADFRKGDYDALFMKPKDGGDGESFTKKLKDKVCGFSSAEGFSRAMNHVRVLLTYSRLRQDEKRARGKKIDQPLKDLEGRLENLHVQLEFGGRPTGGTIYSRVWHRTLEDFSREEFMLCCASLNGEKQEMTFRAMYNPTSLYLAHFIEGVSQPVGFSMLKAGRVGQQRVLLAVSPYEANPVMRTALGEVATYRYVIDTMVKAAIEARADYVVIDDIDLKLRDSAGQVVRHNDGRIMTEHEEGYQEGEDVVIQYKDGEACAPRSFRKAIEKLMRRYQAITHEDVDFKQIQGDDALVQEQFGRNKHHYSIQSARPIYSAGVDYLNLSPRETKEMFDSGYKPLDGTRTVFKIDVKRFIEELRAEGIDLETSAATFHGNPRN